MAEHPIPTLREELAETEARAQHLRRRIAAETCATAGHNWKSVGGRNACCSTEEDPDGEHCSCSIPVHECTACGDCDYGENAEAAETVRLCAERTAGASA